MSFGLKIGDRIGYGQFDAQFPSLLLTELRFKVKFY